MIGDAAIFTELQRKKKGKATIGDNGCGNILDIVDKNSTSSFEKYLSRVDGLKYNFFSKSQIL